MDNGLLQVSQLVLDSNAAGPGRRFTLWVQCYPLAEGACCAPHVWRGSELMCPNRLARQALASPDIEGVTVLGCEPFAQARALAAFCREVHDGGLSVLVFSGHGLRSLRATGDGWVRGVLESTDVLVDAERPTRRPWGARMHLLTDRYEPAEIRASLLQPSLPDAGHRHAIAARRLELL